MSDNAAIIEKLKKILALAERGGTEEEAATAANLAMQLALKHGIDLSALQQSQQQARAGFAYVVLWEDKGGFEQWLINLLAGVTAAHGGKVFYSGNARIGLTQYCAVVRQDLAPLLRSTMGYLVNTVLRLNTEAVRGRSLDREGRAAFRKAFRIACSARIRQRMIDRVRELTRDDAAAQAATGSSALVVLNHFEQETRELQRWLDEESGLKFKESKAGQSKKSLDAAGYSAGRAAGDKVGLDTQVGSTSVDNKRLK